MKYKTLTLVPTKETGKSKINFTGFHDGWESGGTLYTCFNINGFFVLQNTRMEPFFVCTSAQQLVDYLFAKTNVKLTFNQ